MRRLPSAVVMTICTVAIPVYNRVKLTIRAVESALAQSASGLEVLVIDDCSSDGVWEALQTLSDPRLRLLRNEKNLGLFENFNRCLHLARGKYVRLLCCDDVLAPDCLGEEIALLEKHPTVTLLSTRGRLVTEVGRVIKGFAESFAPGVYPGSEAIAASLWLHAHYGYNPFNYPSGVLMRREAALDAGGFDTGMRVAGDVDLFLRVLEHGDLAVLDRVGCDITAHAGQMGQRMAIAGHEIKEWQQLASRYRNLLVRAGWAERVRAQVAGIALGLSLRYWLTGSSEGVLSYSRLRQEAEVRWGLASLGLCRLLVLRLLANWCGIWVRPAMQHLRPK